MAIRNLYLKIQTIRGYSPVAPDTHVSPPIQYGRDCMRNVNHEDGLIPADEIAARSLTALIYREYLDAGYLIPKPDKIVLADINEPAFNHRVPGTVIYAQPGERLRIHVKNADIMPHSFHVHGLKYGIDSDGSWPFGTQSADGRRSDEICPGQTWTYTFDVTDEMLGAWPFHDHHRDIGMNINRPGSKKAHFG
jgi:FtsP/CotA-like multicopper oxidase with cupredoxin domain